MKHTAILTSTMAISLALFQPVFAHAEDQDHKDNGHKGKEKAQGGGEKAGNPAQPVQRPQTAVHAPRSKGGPARSANVNVAPGNAPAGHSRGARSAPAQAATTPNAALITRGSRFAPSTPSVSQRSGFPSHGGFARSYANQGSYTRANNYGGLWILGDSHRDWDRNGIHVWNHHRYGWYDGGWLIIDGGFRPRGFSYSDYSDDLTVVRVQRRLSAQGYALGRADGVIGPATRDAISDYQQDNGLAVTGRINDPLLASLGLE